MGVAYANVTVQAEPDYPPTADAGESVLIQLPHDEAGADLGLNFWGGTDDVGGVISGCGQLSLPDLFLRSQNFEG